MSEARHLQSLLTDDPETVRPQTLQYCTLRLVQAPTPTKYTVQREHHTDALETIDVTEFADVFELIDHLNYVDLLTHVYEAELDDDAFAEWAGKRLTAAEEPATLRPELYESVSELQDELADHS